MHDDDEITAETQTIYHVWRKPKNSEASRLDHRKERDYPSALHAARSVMEEHEAVLADGDLLVVIQVDGDPTNPYGLTTWVFGVQRGGVSLLREREV
jgi:hypothetical protein